MKREVRIYNMIIPLWLLWLFPPLFPWVLPIILLGGAILLCLALIFRGGKRSILTTTTLIIGAVGLFLLGVELFVDHFLTGGWQPGWSLIVVTVCVALVIPLVIVRRVPSLREEVRRRFHM